MATALGTAATRKDLTLQPGATLILTINDLAGTDLTGSTAKMELKSSDRFPNVLLTLTQGAGIDLGGTSGVITVTITPAQSAAILEDSLYDLLIAYPDLSVDKLRFGTVTRKRPVTT